MADATNYINQSSFENSYLLDNSSNNNNTMLSCVEQSFNGNTTTETEKCQTIKDTRFLVLINGYASPVLIFITVVTNCLVCIVLLRRNMRSPTNTLLVAIATSDLFTGVWTVPVYFYMFTLGNYLEWVPYSWCFAHQILTDYLPTMFHTASIWLTVALAVQRYIYVCHAFKARDITIQITVQIIAAIFVTAILSQLCRFFENDYRPVMWPSRVYPNQTVEACFRSLVPVVVENVNVYFGVYYWFRVVCIHLIPCTLLVVLNVLLVVAMQGANARRVQLLKQNRRSESRRLADSNCTTLMLVAVVGVFLLVEFPLAILLITLIIQNSFDTGILISNPEVASLIINFFILLSYPLNFFIYCGMSRQFRATFKGMFCCSTSGPKASNTPTSECTKGDGQEYQSLVTEENY